MNIKTIEILKYVNIMFMSCVKLSYLWVQIAFPLTSTVKVEALNPGSGIGENGAPNGENMDCLTLLWRIAMFRTSKLEIVTFRFCTGVVDK